MKAGQEVDHELLIFARPRVPYGALVEVILLEFHCNLWCETVRY